MVIFPPRSHKAALSLFVLVNVLSSSPEHWNELCVNLAAMASWPNLERAKTTFQVKIATEMTHFKTSRFLYLYLPICDNLHK